VHLDSVDQITRVLVNARLIATLVPAIVDEGSQ